MQIGKALRTFVVEPLASPVQELPLEPELSHKAEPLPADAPAAQ
jgi:hypothetical protein